MRCQVEIIADLTPECVSSLSGKLCLATANVFYFNAHHGPVDLVEGQYGQSLIVAGGSALLWLDGSG